MIQPMRLTRVPVPMAGLAFLLLGCAPQVEKAAPGAAVPPLAPRQEAAPSAPVVPPVLPAEGVYQVDAQATDLRIYVYRAGRLARLGHNHVISSKDVQGTVTLRRDLQETTVRLEIPVATLVVDDPGLREAAGPGFRSEPSESDIAATRRNMLSERVLDAGPYPSIRVQAGVAGGALPDLEMDANITIRDVTLRVRVPVKLESSANSVTANGELEIRQTDFGVTPFSVLGGALSVRDEVGIRYRVVARRHD
jgi:polyisoprenoid-binding protein YceI